MPQPALDIRDLSAGYGPIAALRSASIVVGRGELVAAVGANGAGKSTLLNAVAGFGSVRATSGDIELDGRPIRGLPSYKRVRAGLALVPEGRRVLSPFTVLENLKLCSYAGRADVGERLDQVFDLFPRLKERRSQFAGSLSGGEQQMLAFARGLMVAPSVLLLDEPSMGLSPKLVGEVFAAIEKLRGSEISILLVEQNTALAMSVSERCYVLSRGEVVLSGPSETLADDPAFRSSFLGMSDSDSAAAATLEVR